MNEAFEQALNQLAEEKDINKEELLKMIEASLAAAFRKDYGKKDQNIVVEFMPETMGTKVYDVKKIVEEVVDPMKEWTLEQGKEHKKSAKIGDEIRMDITPKAGAKFGRIAAQTAKQVIVQKIREAERGVLFTDFKAKERQLVSGMVQRLEGDTVLVDLGKTTGVLFPSEQIKGEKYLVGARVKVLILHVEPTAKGPKITLSRSHPDVVRRLFELEVPEIFNGIVEIKAVAREAGSRTKIGVWSLQEGVDPIGACVGQRGSRVQVVMGELNGEKIDIISWAEDAVKFIANALSPAKILNVTLKEETKEAKVGVLSDQLSLAIGKAGQNVRLAARLTGWKIDIAEEKIPGSEPETKKEEEAGTEELNPEAIPAEGEAKNESE
ncbi:MAG: transcription termination/antitermination protein NusA [Candidatus Doudnabacteria bacterium RIFCSPLOWO2_02_FULL_49_13]|uniref:Transcription termination/antitermination protein NusA n=1 Tax=Candidatus Doudnabacteria bacterium RIFCSPHIGHO2_12_FULL_48_16 TaxID=1817838 RepID=A0A1F5PKK7_9BACT|nr:MAG: transcription termination/antitermination protein NusA [Candidatus Doudnabacteria bacterium RIFCSPHIGHO2_02_FULL_49_24]OGE88712.1 MAG: transcription termination/antitermination protein NusA [Candidatus Doudnabacteria bacterium RIFCSPHIGHO2_01_FULL_50_67]OGE90397.1 MAG: transcription termination/antitermination protein NusA [Candidatus Doudnabacteria bacterium RIFCSPHIGHO2_12_FULL_48_16]OGE97104.1 MAG: transcription termination/antitermination protein NusA [Candidatus Doudnabacteria bacte